MPAPPSTLGRAELRDAHETDRIGPYLSHLAQRRSYIWYVALSELRSRQITTVLGNLWHLLNPALSIAVYYVIFGLLLETNRGVDNFLLFITVGLFVFQYTQKSTTDGARSIVGNVGLLKAVKFPRALLPVTSTVTETLAALPTWVVAFAMAFITGEGANWRWILLPALLGVQLVFNLGAAMMAARATTHFRDTTQILPFIFRLLLYGSGVLFSVEAYATESWTRILFLLNPVYCYITFARWCFVGGDLNPLIMASGTAWAIGMLVVGFVWFRGAEELYARD